MSVTVSRSRIPMIVSLSAVAVVWMLGCVWSFREQRDFAALRGFAFPALLPLVIDGLAAATGGVAWAASVDGRSAVAARMATVLAVAASSASNGVWAWTRSGHSMVTGVLAISVPVAANLAFEVLLSELRRQVHRTRSGNRAPLPRLSGMRLLLAPRDTLTRWRGEVLALDSSGALATALPGPAHPPPVPVAPPPQPTLGISTIPPAPPKETPAPSNDAGEASSNIERPLPTGASFDRASPSSLASEPERSEPTRRGTGRGSPGPNLESHADSDPRVIKLAARLRTHPEPAEVTGAEVCRLLGISVTPRTGRRLLSRAREYLAEAPELVGSSSAS